MDYVVHIGHVKDVLAITDREFGLASLVNANEAWNGLPITGAGCMMGLFGDISRPSEIEATYPKIPAGRIAQVNRPSCPFAAITIASARA
jgi:hypothetical protein